MFDTEKITKILSEGGLTGAALTKEVQKRRAKYYEVKKEKNFREMKSEIRKEFLKRGKKHRDFLKLQDEEAKENQMKLEGEE